MLRNLNDERKKEELLRLVDTLTNEEKDMLIEILLAISDT